MAGDFNKLSPEQLTGLAKVLSEAKSLNDRQIEIIEKVLEGEDRISERRISNLTRYFDIYSKSLDNIARKQSDLSDGFLVLDRRADSYSKKVSKSSFISDDSDKKANRGSGAKGNNNSSDDRTSNNSSSESSNNSNKKSRENEWKIEGTRREALKNKNNENLQEELDKITEFFKKNPEARKNDILASQNPENSDNNLPFTAEELTTRATEQELEQLKKHTNLTNSIKQKMLDLELLSSQTEADLSSQIIEVRLNTMQDVLQAEIKAQELSNNLAAEIAYASSQEGAEELGDLRARKSTAKDRIKNNEYIEDQRQKFIEKKELEAKRKNNGILSKEAAADIQKQTAEKFKLDSDSLEKLNKRRIEQDYLSEKTAERAEMHRDVNVFSEGARATLGDRKQALFNLTHDEAGDFDLEKTISSAVIAISDLAKQLEAKVDKIGSFKKDVDTRLQGSSNEQSNGSYWDQLVKDMTSVGAVNPYFKQEDFAENIKSLVQEGIAFDLKQRAFLMTIQDKIANTFNVADGTLLRLIRIQQEDSTAGRLGMESALNAFLNEMYETTEYLQNVASSVRASLGEMEALMKGAEAAEVEYQVQKWLGSLYSVGMSNEAVNAISDTLGKVASGQIEGLTGGGTGNLIVMAANESGLSIADILTEGIDASDTNKLLQATVDYLAKLADDSKENKVVQQELAKVFGVKASDLRAATNLSTSTGDVFGSSLTYGNMISQLMRMAGSLGDRTSMSEKLTNIWENGQYSLAGSMASSPVSYFIYKIAKVLDDTAGGIDLPFLNVMGFGVDLNTTVSDLMRVAAIGGGVLGSLGPIISGLGSSFSGRAMLSKLGINSGSGLSITPRGSGAGGLGVSASGGSVSESGYVGNASGSDVKDSTIQESEDSKKQQMIEAKEEAEANEVDVLNNTVIKIYELLDDVANGNSSFTVQVEGYGLTKTKSSTGSSSGGSALDKLINSASSLSGSGSSSGSNGAGGSSGGGSGGLGDGGVNSNGLRGNASIGGWTTSI